MNDEIASMHHNHIWELAKLPNRHKVIGCKWIFKTKREAIGEIERYKVRLIVKGYNKERLLIAYKPSLQCPPKMLSGLSWI